MTPLFLSNDLVQDESYKYTLEGAKYLQVRSISSQVDIILVTSPANETGHQRPQRGVCIGVALSILFVMAFITVFVI